MSDFIEFENFRIYDDEAKGYPQFLHGKVQIAQPFNPMDRETNRTPREEGLAVFTEEQAVQLAKNLLAALVGEEPAL